MAIATGEQDSGTYGADVVFIHNKQTHRRDAKNAEKFINENNQTLRVLYVSAVKTPLMADIKQHQRRNYVVDHDDCQPQ